MRAPSGGTFEGVSNSSHSDADNGSEPSDQGAAEAEGGLIAALVRISDLDRRVLTLASVVILGAVMSIIDTTIVNVALETLATQLHAPLDEVQWVSTAYLLALATVIPLTGWAAERYGPKRVWMGSVAIFTAGSILSGLASSIGMLIVFRALQGLAGGMILPIGVIILAQAAGPQRMGRVMSVVGVPMLLGPVLGPVLGGLLLQFASWRWIFFVNLPIGIAGLALAWHLLPSGRAEATGGDAPDRLDWTGLALLSPGSALVVFGLSEIASGGGIASTGSWAPILAGAALIALFVRHALHTSDPLIDVRLLARRSRYAAAAVASFVVGGALFGTLLVLPLYFQVARGEDVLATGLLMAPQGLGAAAAMPLAGRITDRVGGGKVAIVGIALLVLGTLAFTTVDSNPSLLLLEAGLVVRGIGLGCTMMPVSAAAYAALSSGEVPRATSALNVVRRIGGSVGTAALAVVLSTSLGSAVSTAPAGGGRGSAAASSAFSHTFWWSLALAAIAIVPVVILAVIESRGEGGPPREAAEEEPEGSPVAAPA